MKKMTEASIQYNSDVVEQVKKQMIQPEYVGKMASFFKSMADENRVRILHALSQNELCVNDLAVALDISQSLVSHQLKLLRLEGLVKPRREGKNIYYSLDDQHVVDMFQLAYTHVRHKVDEHEA